MASATKLLPEHGLLSAALLAASGVSCFADRISVPERGSASPCADGSEEDSDVEGDDSDADDGGKAIDVDDLWKDYHDLLSKPLSGAVAPGLLLFDEAAPFPDDLDEAPEVDLQTIKRVIYCVQKGALSKARAALGGPKVVRACLETYQQLAGKHPTGAPPVCDEPDNRMARVFSKRLVKNTIREFKILSSGGPSLLTPTPLKNLVGHRGGKAPDVLH